MPYWNFEQLLPTFARAAVTSPLAPPPPNRSVPADDCAAPPLAVNKSWSWMAAADCTICTPPDHIFGQVLDSLERHGVADNTLVIFTSDNGCAHYIGVDQLEAQGHHPSAGFRGYKSDAWDGGHRVPFIPAGPA